MAHLNQFGIKEFYETSPFGSWAVINNPNVKGGWQYFSDMWNLKIISEFQPVDNTFLNDWFMHFKKVADSYVLVRGDGRITLGSENIEPMYLRIYDDNNLNAGIKNALGLKRGLRWTSNNEFTFYFNRIEPSVTTSRNKYTDGSIEINLTSDHHFGSSIYDAGLCPFNAHHYTLVIENSGRMYFSGEPYHRSKRLPKPDDIETIDFWDTNFQGIPLKTWIGIKIIKRVVGTNKIFLEVYRDMSEGFNGGTWHKLFEFLHERGNWYNSSMDDPYTLSQVNASESVIPVPKFVDEPHTDNGGGMCYIKITPVRELDLKWISCRDIDPMTFAHSPNTIEDDLDDSIASTDGDTNIL